MYLEKNLFPLPLRHDVVQSRDKYYCVARQSNINITLTRRHSNINITLSRDTVILILLCRATQ